ncbi:site-specific DNA-methyltransferase [Halomonas sp. V046]|uniref:site-specific DNA-methyltransferase n=1 Tax=Halomonas sp. V046 TaxID=3459611 RepID=UPI004043BD16
MSKYEGLDRDTLIRLLEQRDRGRQLGLVWERDEIEADQAINDDFVGLSLDAALSHGEAPWENLIIEGDNYDALRALRMTHAGRIRCIYIDPPYNTGNKDFVYNDRFVDKNHRFRHSLWLEFIYKRLLLAKELLAEDGVIFVSIDDNELFHLGMLMDEVFGPKNKLATFIWQTDGNFDNQAKIKIAHEYILAYSPNPDRFPMPRVVDPNIGESSKIFRPEIRNTIVKNGPKNPVSEIRLPSGFPAAFDNGTIPPRSDRWPHISTEAHIENGRLANEVIVESGWANRGLCQAFIDSGFKSVKDTKGQLTSFVITENGAIENIKKRDTNSHVISVLRNLGNTQSDGAGLAEMGIEFTYPKPVSMMTYLLSILDDPNATILDFFAGSGTTAHAITKLNAKDGGQRRFIMISNSESTKEEPKKNLCRDVCAERIRRIMSGYTNIKGENIEGVGGSFAYLRTRQVAMHRLPTKIAHGEVWYALQLLHEAPLQPWMGSGFQAIEAHDGWVAYLADQKADSIERLQVWLDKAEPIHGRVYSWSPDRFEARAPSLDWPRIPDALQARFSKRKR